MSRFKNLLEELKNRVVILDGAMGTMLSERGWKPPVLPEELNETDPEIIFDIHTAYVKAGADIITTNSFGGSPIKLAHRGLASKASYLNELAAKIARKAAGRDILVAGSVGPLGSLLYPIGDIDFDTAVKAFSEQIKGLVNGGADFILIETMLDLQEAKAAVIALKETAPDIPFAISFTFEKSFRTVTGSLPEVASVFAQNIGAFAVGANCGFGPDGYHEVAKRLAKSSFIYTIVYPNAGIKGDTDYYDAESFSEEVKKIASYGINIVGGCCGSTPLHIKALKQKVRGISPNLPKKSRGKLFLCSRTVVKVAGVNEPLLIIGERINVSRKGPLRDEVKEYKWDTLKQEAILQKQKGADVLDVNVGLPDIDQAKAMKEAVSEVQLVSDLPLSIDSDRLSVLESGLRYSTGIAIMNSITAKKESIYKGLQLALKYGASPIILLIDEQGIAEDLESKIRIFNKIKAILKEVAFPEEKVIIDPLTLSVGANPMGVLPTLKALSLISKEGFNTVLGISNVSHGLPARAVLNRTFLAMSISYGLSTVIANPCDDMLMDTVYASNLLMGKDVSAKNYIDRFSFVSKKEAVADTKADESVDIKDPKRLLYEAIVKGRIDMVDKVIDKVIDGFDEPVKVISEIVVPALSVVGKKYEEHEYFLPHLIMSAQVAQKVSEAVEKRLKSLGKKIEPKATVVMATVAGDLHDLGKNIVCMVLKNHGFNVIDLGKDVKREVIFEAINRYSPKVVGLSALMTSTMQEMAEVVKEIKEKGFNVKVIVGGAAVTAGFAKKIGADGYSTDAVSAVRLVNRLVSGEEGFIVEKS